MHVHTNIIRFHRALLRLYLKSYNNSKLLPWGRPFIYSVATWPFRYHSTKACVLRNGQVATASCSVVECWLACYSSRAVELLEEAARALPGLNRRFHHHFAGSIQYR